MRSRTMCMMPALLLAVNLFFAVTYVRAEPPAAEGFPVDRLLAACQAAETGFRPLTADDLKAASAELAAAVDRLDRELTANSQTGPTWREYLEWDRMHAQLQRDTPDRDELSAVYRIYRGKHEHLKLIWLADVGEALSRYLLTAEALSDPKEAEDLKQRHEGCIADLPGLIKRYGATPNAEAAREIANRLRWLEAARQAPELVAAVRRERGGPNLLIRASGELLDHGIARSVDETEPVRDVILGTDIYGDGRTTGRVSTKLVPDAKRGVFDMILLGTTKSQTVGYNGPAQVHSTGSTGIGARKRLWLTAEGLAALPAVSNAKTRTDIDSIQTNRGRRLVERIAWKRACSQKSMAESIAAQHAEERVNQRLNREAAAMIDSTNQWYVETIRKPLLDYELFPQRLQFSTTDKTLYAVALQTDRFQLAAHTQPPEPVQPCDLALRVHESMLNNMADTALAGLLLREDALLTFLESLGMPEAERERVQSPPGELPWSIDFSRLPSPPSQIVQPVGFTIADGGFAVTVRGRRYIRGNQMRANMDVRAAYKIEKTENGFKAVRKELGVTRRDGGFAGAAGTVLERWFGGFFDEEILLEDMDLPGEWSKAPASESDHGQADQRKTIKMKTIQCVCQDGWLVLAWRRAAAE